MSKLIVVLGVSGAQGGAVASTFSSLPGWRVRGVTCDSTKTSLQPLRDQGIELVTANIDDRESLVKAFEGVNVIFAVTNYWALPGVPKVQTMAQENGISLPRAAYFAEIEQFKNIFTAAAEVMSTGSAKLENFIVSSLADVSELSGGKNVDVLHFDSKAHAVKWLQNSTDKDLQELNSVTSYVQLGFYLDNCKLPSAIAFTAKRQADGSIIYTTLSKPHDRKLPYVHVPTDLGPCVHALLSQPPGTTVLATCAEMTTKEYVGLLEKEIGEPISIKALSEDELIGVVGPDFARDLIAVGEWCSSVGYAGPPGLFKRPKDIGVDIGLFTPPEKYNAMQDWNELLK